MVVVSFRSLPRGSFLFGRKVFNYFVHDCRKIEYLGGD